MTPNIFAYFALCFWPFLAFYLYVTRPLAQATVWTMLGGYLLLPAAMSIKFEMIPALDKGSITVLAAAFGCFLKSGKLPKLFHGIGFPELLIVVFVLSPIITSALNTDAVTVGPRVVPAETTYDGLSAVTAQLLMIIPFLLGRQFLRSSVATTEIIKALVIAGLAYSVLILIELRMSPQLNNWVYGYFPSDWLQVLRSFLGWRPAVFLGHGLPVAFFAMTAAIASAALWRVGFSITRIPPAALTAYLALILALCQSLGAMVYAVVAVPLVRWTGPALQRKVAIGLVTIALVYPMLRTFDLVPTQYMLEAADALSHEREQSLKARFDNEKILLEHATHRIWFGWGRWGRNRVYEAEGGGDFTLTDGLWIITLGSFGIVGFLAQFGLLTFSVVRANSAARFIKASHERVYFLALGLIVAISVVDLLPNSGLTPWVWLLAGSLLGRAEALTSSARQGGNTWKSPYRESLAHGNLAKRANG